MGQRNGREVDPVRIISWDRVTQRERIGKIIQPVGRSRARHSEAGHSKAGRSRTDQSEAGRSRVRHSEIGRRGQGAAMQG